MYSVKLQQRAQTAWNRLLFTGKAGENDHATDICLPPLDVNRPGEFDEKEIA